MQPLSEWSFSNFRYDAGNSRLTRDGEAIPLRPKTFALLGYLLEQHGRLIDKSHLLDAVWGHRHVSESVLEGCISEVRKALGDDAKAPRFLETVARKGYRFIAEVRAATPETAVLANVPPAHPESCGWIGREDFLQRLQESWSDAKNGLRRFVMLTGEAGMGKTTLLEMFLQLAAQDKPIVLWCQCIEHFGAGEAFLPLLGALQHSGPDLIPVLRALAPTWLVQLPGLSSAETRAGLQQEVLGATRERMLREGCDMLEAFSAHAPVIVVLEDLHWSDFATLELLAALGRRRSQAELLIVGSYRPSEVAAPEHPLRRMHQELQMHRLSTELALTAFSRAELEAYLARRFPDARFPEDIAGIVYRRSGGQPLFLVNLIDYLLAEGILQQSGEWWSVAGGDALESGIPDDIRLMIEHRIARFGEQDQRLLEAASVAGAISSAALLAAALKQDLLDVESCCERLARGGPILEAAGTEEWPDGTLSGNYAFRHALYAEVLYQRLSPAYRSALHQRLGERLESAYQQRAGEIAGELARHFEEGRDFPKAVRYLCRAAANAAESFANREALGYLQRACLLTPRLPEKERDAQRFTLLNWMSNIRCSMYNLQDAIKDLHELLQAARTAENKCWEVRALVGLSRMYYLANPRLCVAWVDEAFAQSQALTDAREKLLVKGYHAHWHLTYVGWRDEYREACREALAAAYETGDAHTLSRHLVAQTVCECYTSDYLPAIDSATAGMAAAERAGDGYLFMVCLSLRCYALFLSGDWGTLRELVNAGLAAAEKNGNSMQMRRFRANTLMQLVEAGDYETARHYGEMVAAMRVSGDNFTSNLCQIYLTKVYLHLCDYPRALRCLQAIERKLEADDVLLDGLSALWYPWAYSEYGLAVGELELAQDKALELLVVALPRGDKTFIALARQQLALLALARSDTLEADAQLAEALSTVAECGAPLARWRVYQAAEKICASQGEEKRAAEYRQQTAQVFSRLAESLSGSDPLRQTLLCRSDTRNESTLASGD